jgi:hypothetical protein
VICANGLWCQPILTIAMLADSLHESAAHGPWLTTGSPTRKRSFSLLWPLAPVHHSIGVSILKTPLRLLDRFGLRITDPTKNVQLCDINRDGVSQGSEKITPFYLCGPKDPLTWGFECTIHHWSDTNSPVRER